MHIRPAAAPASHGGSATGVISRPTRYYEISALRADGSLKQSQFHAPSFPAIDAAFSAFAAGALLDTPDGPIAIEDLMPGDWLKTTSGEAAQVVWIGSAGFGRNGVGPATPLIRIMSDSFGPARPASFVTVGPAARLLQTPPHLRGTSGGAPMLTPARDFVDMVNVIEVTPPSPVQLFHICLTRHAAVCVGGIEMETFHPGMSAGRAMTHTQRDFLLSLFPRISHLTDFGPLAHPRAPDETGAPVFAA